MSRLVAFYELLQVQRGGPSAQGGDSSDLPVDVHPVARWQKKCAWTSACAALKIHFADRFPGWPPITSHRASPTGERSLARVRRDTARCPGRRTTAAEER